MNLQRTDDWYVGFVPAPNRGLWRLARGRFGHCMAFRPLDEGWLLVEQNVWGLTVRLMSFEEADRLIAFCNSNGTILYLPSRRRDFRWLAPPLLTCTTAIAALLGVRAWMLTPRQLHGALLRRGAIVPSGSEPPPPKAMPP